MSTIFKLFFGGFCFLGLAATAKAQSAPQGRVSGCLRICWVAFTEEVQHFEESEARPDERQFFSKATNVFAELPPGFEFVDFSFEETDPSESSQKPGVRDFFFHSGLSPPSLA